MPTGFTSQPARDRPGDRGQIAVSHVIHVDRRAVAIRNEPLILPRGEVGRSACARILRGGHADLPRGNYHGDRIEVVRRKSTQVVHGVEARRLPRHEQGEDENEERRKEKRTWRVEVGSTQKESRVEAPGIARGEEAIACDAYQASRDECHPTRRDGGQAGRSGCRATRRRSEGSRH